MPTTPVICTAGIRGVTLSAFMDGALSVAQAAQMRAHITTCAACQQQLTDLTAVGSLLRRPVPALESTALQQRRTWLAVRARITQPKRRFVVPTLSRGTIWKGAGVALAVAIVLVLSVQFAGHRATRSAATHLTPTATPQLPTPEQAWGAQYIKQVPINNAAFRLSAIAPDGTFAVGSLVDPLHSSPSALATLNLATGKTQTLYSQSDGNLGDAFTDGHYIGWSVQPNINSLEEDIMIFDSGTQKTTTIRHTAPSPDDPNVGWYPRLEVLGIDHGYLLWSQHGKPDSDISLYVTNLVDGQQATIATQLGGIDPEGQIVWPHVFYHDQYAQLHLYSIPEAMDQLLPPSYAESYTFTGSTVFGRVSLVDKGHSYEQIQALRGPNFTTATWQPVYDDYSGTAPDVNDRIVVSNDGFPTYKARIWDLALRKMLTLPANLAQNGPGLFHGKWLIYATATSDGAQNILNIIDTSHLPTK